MSSSLKILYNKKLITQKKIFFQMFIYKKNFHFCIDF
jgi:hypothetical protein